MESKVKAKGKPVAARQRKGRTSTSRISSKHQVTVPVDILRASGLRDGDAVTFVITSDGAIEMRKKLAERERNWQNVLDSLANCASDFPRDFDWEKERAAAWGE